MISSGVTRAPSKTSNAAISRITSITPTGPSKGAVWLPRQRNQPSRANQNHTGQAGPSAGTRLSGQLSTARPFRLDWRSWTACPKGLAAQAVCSAARSRAVHRQASLPPQENGNLQQPVARARLSDQPLLRSSSSHGLARSARYCCVQEGRSSWYCRAWPRRVLGEGCRGFLQFSTKAKHWALWPARARQLQLRA